ncbi:phosphotransferase [Thorsellia anophelis]|uniref:Thiamine kinase n=1 Tax=Thorsellia anophelis DSM 18579 TaxID=1123402 RepID=A0A1I0BLY3_9GAMM|nr:phosphotransferase [Thorsellia anophelis]SET07959.1 thiamine kinase [Thorsellia anophelis DSM 18579]
MQIDTYLIPNSLRSVVDQLLQPSLNLALKKHAQSNPNNSSFNANLSIKSTRFTPISGLSGTNWIIDLGDKKWIARENSKIKMQLGINRKIEHKILRQLEFQNIAPHCVTLSREWLILEWLPNNKTLTPQLDYIPQKLGYVIQKIHSSPLSRHQITLKKRFNFLFNQIDKKRITYKWAKNHSIFNYAQPPSRSHMVLSHMDVHIDNLIFENNSLKLIDWEYAGDTEEHIALAAIIDSMNWSKSQAINFLANYIESREMLVKQNENQYQAMSHRLYEAIIPWIPWIHYLQFLWFEIRWNQTNNEHFIQLSQELWDKFA